MLSRRPLATSRTDPPRCALLPCLPTAPGRTGSCCVGAGMSCLPKHRCRAAASKLEEYTMLISFSRSIQELQTDSAQDRYFAIIVQLESFLPWTFQWTNRDSSWQIYKLKLSPTHIYYAPLWHNWPLCSYDLLLQVNSRRRSAIRTGAQKDSALLKKTSAEQKKKSVEQSGSGFNLADIWAVVFKSIQNCRKKCWQISHEVFLWQSIHKLEACSNYWCW